MKLFKTEIVENCQLLKLGKPINYCPPKGELGTRLVRLSWDGLIQMSVKGWAHSVMWDGLIPCVCVDKFNCMKKTFATMMQAEPAVLAPHQLFGSQ